MRSFIFDVWVWSKAKHSRLLKQIRVKALSFPSDMFCLNEAAKDADVSPYMKSDEFEVTIGNLRIVHWIFQYIQGDCRCR